MKEIKMQDIKLIIASRCSESCLIFIHCSCTQYCHTFIAIFIKICRLHSSFQFMFRFFKI